MLSRIRPWYEKVTLPLGHASRRLGLRPDFWTWFSLLVAFLGGAAFAGQHTAYGLLLVIVANIADMLDGATARALGAGTVFGKVFDHVSDRYAEFAILTGLLLGGYASPLSVMFALTGMIMASYVRAKAESTGGVKDCTVGLAGRQEKLMLIYLGCFLALVGWPQTFDYIMWLLGFISHVTTVQRMLHARRELAWERRSTS